MNRRSLLILLLAVLLATPLAASSNDSAWLSDIQHLATELARLHVNAFTHISQEAFSTEVERLKGDVPELEDHEVVVRILQLVARIGDSHTMVYSQPPPRVPIDLYWFADGLFVVRAAETERDLIGARLIAIDGRPLQEILDAIADIIPHENDPWLREMAPRHLVAPDVLHALGLIGAPALATFRFMDRAGLEFDRVLLKTNEASINWSEAIPLEQRPLYRRDSDRNYWYEYIAWGNTLYVAYNRCQEMASLSVDEFASELAAFAQSHPVARLVLDLRNNSGGDSGLVTRLFTKTFVALPHVNHPDRFFVVIGPGTFSSAMMNAISIAQQTNATLIGTPTGGKPNHFGNVRTFKLPFSGLTVQYSTRWFALIPDADPASVIPDVEVAVTSDDYFAGRDPVMERISPRLERRRGARR